MISEIAFAVTYIVSPLYSNLPRRRVDDFAIELNNLLKIKIAPFWFPNQPFRGIHQRCFRVNGPYADPILYVAASKSGINQEELLNFLPKEELKIWIDPGEVTYQIGDQSSEIKCLFRYNSAINDQMSQNVHYNNHNTNNNHESQSNQSNFYLPKSLVPSFTVSSFAKTKFGSTKLKPNTSSSLIEPVRPNSLKLSSSSTIADSTNNSCSFTPDSCNSSVLSPNCQNLLGSPESTALNISCYLPWNIDTNSNTNTNNNNNNINVNNAYSNLLTINIPHYSSKNGRESSGAGSLNSELNSPVHGY